MKFKKLLLFSGIILILSLSFVSASDNSTPCENINNNSSPLKDSINTFNDLQNEINNENDYLILDKDYEYVDGNINGVLINKSITIDGNGHTLNGNGKSRIFYISSQNVTIKNIIFKNGLAKGLYFNKTNIGGGAIYWNAVNGKLINSIFINNTGAGLLYDEFENEEVVNDDGSILITYRMRPMGASTNRGGAIVWLGDNGYIKGCTFQNNHVGYPNGGGAVFWVANNATIDESFFENNHAWFGASVLYQGDRLIIKNSKFLNNSFFNRDESGIFGENISIINSSLPRFKELSGNLKIYYKSTDKYHIIVYDENGKEIAGKYVTFKINKKTYKVKTNKYGEAVLKLNKLKPGKYTLSCKYGNFTHKNKITIKSRIITKNLVKHKDKTAIFKVKILDKYGDAYMGQTVKIKFKSKIYKLKTNSKGIAKLKISKKLKKGNYKIKTSYLDLSVKNTIKCIK